MINISKKELEKKYEEIRMLYLNDDRPWVIGYSGGKDSTTILQMIYTALKELPAQKLKKKVYVVSSDTMVENPLILNYLVKNLTMINDAASADALPIEAHLLKPEITDTFWTLLLGKGYPTPRQKFRWCTSRLKINPIDKFINDVVEEYNEVIVVLGVRREESQSRNESIERRSVEGKLLKVHATNSKAYVYAPIEHFDVDEIWYYLMQNDSPWGNKNSELLSLYTNASDVSECPIQQDKDAPSCGNSRFGCWVCTVVVKDKSLTGFIESGYEELRPLLEYRNNLVEMRDLPENRQKWRTDGTIYYIEKEGARKRGLGPFTLTARKEMLRMLLDAEKEYNERIQSDNSTSDLFKMNNNEFVKLISDEELKIIRRMWIDSGDWEDSAKKIVDEFRKDSIFKDNHYSPIFTDEQLRLLERVCLENQADIDLVKMLFNIESKHFGLKRRNTLFKEFEKVLKQDWVHEDILEIEE